MRTTIGEELTVNESTGDLQEWFDMSAAVRHVWEEEPRRKMSRELQRIQETLTKLVNRLGK
jgi:hypothetical protein